MRNRISKLERKVIHFAGSAIARFNMICEGDHVLAAISGGKDSSVLLHVLSALKEKSPVKWKLSAVAVDHGDPNFPVAELHEITDFYNIPFEIESTDIFKEVPHYIKGKKRFCSMCSRFRRGALLRVAERLGANRLALGHHRADLLETFIMNICFTGRLMAMAPVFSSCNGAVDVIRPLILVPGILVGEFSKSLSFPSYQCHRGTNTRRHWAGEFLKELDSVNPHVRESLLHALGNPVETHLLLNRNDSAGDMEKTEKKYHE